MASRDADLSLRCCALDAGPRWLLSGNGSHACGTAGLALPLASCPEIPPSWCRYQLPSSQQAEVQRICWGIGGRGAARRLSTLRRASAAPPRGAG